MRASDRIWMILLHAALLLPAIVASTSGAQATECALRVSSSASLRDALASLPAGSTLCIEPGVYEGGFTLEKSMTLRGLADARQVVLESVGEANVPVIQVRGTGRDPVVVTLIDLTLTGATAGDPDRTHRDHGLYIHGGCSVILKGVVCRDNAGAGVYVEDEAMLYAVDCTFRGGAFGGITESQSQARFQDCTFSANGLGVGVGTQSQIFLLQCRLTDNADAGAFLMTGQAHIEDCEISGNDWGIVVGDVYEEAPQVRIISCDIERNVHAGVTLLNAACYDPEVPESDGPPPQILGERNRIPGPESENGNGAAAICPTYPGAPWPDGFMRD